MAGPNVALAALSAGTPELALNVANALLAKDRQDVAALIIRGDALTMLGRPGEAETSYAAAVAADPGSSEAQIGLGRLQLQSNPAQAQLLFLSVLQREPRNKIALSNLGIAYDLQGNHAGAQDAYRRALAVDPSMRAASVNLALSMALSGQAQDAVQMLQPFASDPQASRRIRHDLAAAMVLAGDRQGAARILGADMTPEQVDQALRAYETFAP